MAMTDITARKRAEADRLILNKLESTGILAGGIAHDFNNLLTVILLNLELAQRLKLPDEKLACYLEEAKETCTLAGRLTAQLVTLCRGRRAGPEGDAPFRIDPGIRPAGLERFQRAVRILRGGGSLGWPRWTPGQMGQVIRGIVLNAREAMPQGGMVLVRAENVVLSAQEQPSLAAGEYVRLSIADQGAGIAKDVLPKIFDPYFSTKHRGDQKGMGLGLTICHAVVQKHGGAIAVKSEVGVGTTFRHLPSRSPEVEHRRESLRSQRAFRGMGECWSWMTRRG